MSAVSSEVPERTRTGVPHNGGGVSRGNTSSPLMFFIIFAACLVVGMLLVCGIWAPLHWRKKRKAKEMHSQMEISTFAQARGYTVGGEAAVQQVQAASESTVADTRNATIGETVPSTSRFEHDVTPRSDSDRAAQAERGPALGSGNVETSR